MLQCARGLCTEIATSALGYDVAATTAWLYDLDAETIAGTKRRRDIYVPLCWVHADRITVPLGWQLEDRRTAMPEPDAAAAAPADPLFEPRQRPEPESAASASGSEADAAPDATAARLSAEPTSSLLERAFRAAPRH